MSLVQRTLDNQSVRCADTYGVMVGVGPDGSLVPIATDTSGNVLMTTNGTPGVLSDAIDLKRSPLYAPVAGINPQGASQLIAVDAEGRVLVAPAPGTAFHELSITASTVRNYDLEAVAGIDPLLVGKTPSATTQDAFNSDGTRNASAWFAPYAKYFTAVSSSLSILGPNGQPWHVTAIRPDAVVSSVHVGNLAGATAIFTPADGTPAVTRILGAQAVIAGDLCVYPLTVPLPANILPMAVMDSPLPAPYTFAGDPAWYFDQYNVVRVAEVVSLQTGGLDELDTAAAANRAAWSRNPLAAVGDSTSPSGLILGGRPVLLSCFFEDDTTLSQSPDVGENATAIQAALGTAYPLTIANLPNYPIPKTLTLASFGCGPSPAPLTVGANQLVLATVRFSSATIVLPQSPPANTQVGIGISGTNPSGYTLTISPQGSDQILGYIGSSLTLSFPTGVCILQYNTAGNVWTIISNNLPLPSLDARYAQRVAVPVNSAAPGAVGQWSSDDSYFYVYGMTGWRRIAAASF